MPKSGKPGWYFDDSCLILPVNHWGLLLGRSSHLGNGSQLGLDLPGFLINYEFWDDLPAVQSLQCGVPVR
jgi:hypothetical protein